MKRCLQVFTYLASVCALHAAPGDVDLAFDSGSAGGFEPGVVRILIAQPDGKVMLGGHLFEIGGAERHSIARLNADGLADSTFDPGTGANGAVLSLALPTDGKVVAGGSFTKINDVTRNGVARLNSNGSLDMTFDPGAGPKRGFFVGEGRVWSVAVQTDGRALVGGDFTSFNGVSRNLIVRLNEDGKVNTLFTPGTGADGTIVSIAVQTDGKVLIAGKFTTSAAPNAIGISRLNTDGSLDGTFHDALGTNASVNSFVLQTDGKVMLGGVYGDTKRGFVARLKADGTLDGSFNSGTGANAAVFSVAVQTNGKVLVGGDFTNFDDTSQNHLTRLNADGSLDSTFNPGGAGAGAAVWAVAVQPDGKLLVGGDFDEINGQPRVFVARLLGDAPVTPSIPLNIQKIGSQVLITWSNSTFFLQSALLARGPYSTISGATSPHTNLITGSQLYFRLQSL